VTAANLGRSLAVVLDGSVQSVARIDSRITTDGRILGNFTPQDVQNFSLILRSGSLPAPLSYLAEETIGASLGADSIRAGMAASVAGLILVMVFMLAYYRWSGLNAIVTILINLIIVLALMSHTGSVMTLPGIAGFVLTIGIGVDSNVLVFERIKEELEAGRSVRAALNAFFPRRSPRGRFSSWRWQRVNSIACRYESDCPPRRGGESCDARLLA
jgi:preprotein translocase subunit SecD